MLTTSDKQMVRATPKYSYIQNNKPTPGSIGRVTNIQTIGLKIILSSMTNALTLSRYKRLKWLANKLYRHPIHI